jgi:uncharacterized protein (TIGR00255 family)
MKAKALSVASMTGYGTASHQIGALQVEIDVRSVNSRYLDVTVKCADELRNFEPVARERIGQAMARGKVEVRMSLRVVGQAAVTIPSAAAVSGLLAAQTAVLVLAPSARALSVSEILKWPGVNSDPAADQAEARDTAVNTALDAALVMHRASREREGTALAAVISDRIAKARIHADEAVPAAARVRAEFPERLRQKVESAGIAVDRDRLAQEVVLYTQRIDIDEEIDRLRTHLSEVQRVLEAGGQVGKRLDFLMQELNREANTLGSKSVDTTMTRIAVELKVLIEQMREQVQNLQ